MELENLKEMLINKKLADVKKILQEMNEYDIASTIEELPSDLLIQAYRLLPKTKAVDVFVNMDEEVQRELIASLTKTEAKYIIEDMFTDDAADLFEEMPAMLVTSLLSNVDKETRNDINKLLKYPENSAGSLMAIEYIHLKKGLTIKKSIERIRKQADDFVSYDSCFVTDNERKLLGRVSVKDLLINDTRTLIDDIMENCHHTLSTQMDQEDVVKLFQDYDYSTLPVVDLEGRLVGVITIDDVVDIMEEEATEDIEKMAAIVPTEKSYDKTTVFETFKARIPWLLLLMISATFTGKIIQGFESQLAAYTILTAFIPMLMDTGGNAGGQASVSIIRALSLNDIDFKDIFKVIFKEARVALLCAITLGICNFIKMLIIDSVTIPVALCVCITLVITIIIAKVIGCSLPMIAKKIGFDPAVMASPFITTIV
ncbi:MAG: magnesium transporter, partial [Bacilli bacterium]|nr:magnesium transporter [Bacilli bacterium]